MNKFSTIFVIVLSIVALLIGAKGCLEHKAKESIIDQYQKILQSKDDTIRKWVDEDSNNHLTIKQLELDKEILYKVVANSKAAELRIKPKQIKQVSNFTSSVDTVFKIDSIYKDNYITLVLKDSSIRISMKDSISITEYWKRKWLFGHKETFIDLKNTNKYITLDNLTSYKVKSNKPTIIIAPYLGYDIINRKISLGICITPYALSIKL